MCIKYICVSQVQYKDVGGTGGRGYKVTRQALVELII